MRGVLSESPLRGVATGHGRGSHGCGIKEGFSEGCAQVVRPRVCKNSSWRERQLEGTARVQFLIRNILICRKWGSCSFIIIRPDSWCTLQLPECFSAAGQAASLFQLSRQRNQGSKLSRYLPRSPIFKRGGISLKSTQSMKNTVLGLSFCS